MAFALFVIGFLGFIALCCWLGKDKTHGADHNATGTRQYWTGGH